MYFCDGSVQSYFDFIFVILTLTVIILNFQTPFVFGHPLFFIEIIIFEMHKNMFFGHPLFLDTPIFHRNN